MKPNEDILWKGILEDVFDDFLRFIDPKAEFILDLERGFDFLDKELQQVYPPEYGEYSSKIVDKLVKVFRKNGQEEYILVHVEVQGQYHKDFGKRMFGYYYRLFEKYDKQITTYAIFTEATNITRPNFFKMKFMGTSMHYKFNTYKIADQNEEELIASNNPFALVVLAAKAVLKGKQIKDNKQRDQLFLDTKLTLIRQLLQKNLSKVKIRRIMNFIKYYINFDSKEINIKFEKELNILTENKSIMGLEELLLEWARNEGKEEGKEQEVQHLIIKLGLDDKKAAEVAEVSLEFVERIRTSLF